MHDTTHIALVDTAYLAHLVKHIGDKSCWETAISLIVPIIAGAFILLANRMTLSRIKGDTLYHARLTNHSQWELKLREAQISFTAAVYECVHALLYYATQQVTTIERSSRASQSKRILGEENDGSDLSEFLDPIHKVLGEINLDLKTQIAKMNLASTTLSAWLDPKGEHYQEIKDLGQAALSIEYDCRSKLSDVPQEVSLQQYGQFNSEEQSKLYTICDQLELAVNKHMASVRSHLEKDAK